MEMRHRLPGVWPIVHHGPKATISYSFLACNIHGYSRHVAEQQFILLRRASVILDVPTRHHQEMNRCLGIDVRKSNDFGVGVQHRRGNLARDDATEQAISHRSVYGRALALSEGRK